MVTGLVAAFWKDKIPQTTVGTYETALMDLDMSIAGTVFKRILAECKFFPSIAEIRALAREETSNLPTVDEAYDEALKAVRRWGHTRQPEWSHPVIAQAMDGIGWREFCLSENIMATRVHFKQAYERCAERYMRDEQSAGCLGLPPKEERKRLGPTRIGKLLTEGKDAD